MPVTVDNEELKNFLKEIKLETLSKLNVKQLVRLNEKQIFEVCTNEASNKDSRQEAAIVLFNAIQSLKEKQEETLLTGRDMG